MIKLFLSALTLCLTLCQQPAFAFELPFRCRLRETTTFLPELSTYSGYRWIECLVTGLDAAEVEGVSVNNGKCQTFDYWYAGRSFVRGQPIYIPYACMSPIRVTIAANGLMWTMPLRSSPENAATKSH
jgi:hypothetical protein